MKVFACNIETTATYVTPGAFDTDHKTYFRFAAKNGWVYITELQLEGKKAMDVAAFLRGFRS
jgi:methionyl-tRNA formyltransferase